MSVTSILNEVVQNLEDNQNLIRIKKVMYCGCQGKWENNSKKLQNISVESLVKELYWKTQDLEKLYHIFDKILSKINKKTEYSLIIDVILEQVSKLYLEVDEAKKENYEIPWLAQSSDHTMTSNTQTSAHNCEDLKALFEVRFKLMQHSNPLRVKILIYSAIEQEFNFSSQDWMKLRAISLDQLLQQLVQTFPSLPALESHLKKVSTYLDESDEMLQVATVIVEALKSLYEKNQRHYLLSKTLPAEDRLDLNLHSVHHPVPELVACENGARNRPIYQSFQHSNLSDIQTLQLINLDDLKDLNSSLEDPSLASGLTSSTGGITSDFADSNPATHEADLNPSIVLADEINQRVGYYVNLVSHQLETLQKDLEIEVDNWIKDQASIVKPDLKHQILQQFMEQTEHKVHDLAVMLSQPETAASSPLTDEDNSSTGSISQQKYQNHMMEHAKQGDCTAITALINQSLNPRGINTLTKTKNGCLHVVLESEEVPKKESTAQFVHKKLVFLKIQSIQSIKVYGRKSGNKAVAWAQEFAYHQV